MSSFLVLYSVIHRIFVPVYAVVTLFFTCIVAYFFFMSSLPNFSICIVAFTRIFNVKFVNPLHNHSRRQHFHLLFAIILIFVALSSTFRATTSQLGRWGCYGRVLYLPYSSPLSQISSPIIIFSSDITP